MGRNRCAHLDRNDLGLTDLAGLDLLGGRSVWVHYRPEDRERLRAFASCSGQELLVVAEGAGGVLGAGTIEPIGPGHGEIWSSSRAWIRADRRLLGASAR